jgi:hypothetical protein
MERQKARRAYEILDRMKKLYRTSNAKSVKPNIVAATAVINACARPADKYEKGDAFIIAKLTMEEVLLGEFGKPNFLTFSAFLSVCSSTLPSSDGRDDAVRRTFEQCRMSGQVAQIVLEKFKKAASTQLYEELLGDILDENGVPQLPREWSVNVQGERHVIAKDTQTIPRSTELQPNAAVQTFPDTSGVYSSRSKFESQQSYSIKWIPSTISTDPLVPSQA